MPRTVLLADDSVTAQNMGRRILMDAGYEVITVNNGSAALKKIHENRPDLIVLDVYMPGYGGLEVCQRLKESGETMRIPVLLSVGKMEPFKADEAKRVRADGHVLQSRLSSRDLPLVWVAGARREVNTLEDIDAADVLAFQLGDGRVRYAVSLREQRRTGPGTPLVAATVMVWDASLVWRQFIFAPTLLEFRYGRLRPWKSWPPFFWRRLDAMSGFAFQHDYSLDGAGGRPDDAVLWTVLEPRSNTVVAAAEVDGPC